MRTKKNLKHMGRNGAEKRAYLDSVERHGPTVPSSPINENDLPIDTESSGIIGEPERFSSEGTKHPSGSTRPYRSLKTQLAVGIEDNLMAILGGIILIFSGICGYLFTQQSTDNREIGEIKTANQNVSKQIIDLETNYRDLEKQQNEFDKSIALIQQAFGFYNKK